MTFRPSDVLAFWFAAGPSERMPCWFEKTAAFDTACARFTEAIRSARAGRYDDWAATPKGGLALIVLLDQLSRNVFRADAEAFAADPQARRIARGMIERGFDRDLTPVERMFVYLPFEHSEDPADQDESVRLFDTIRDAAGGDGVDYARAHRDVIARFGRFPHRNAVLGRVSTAAEQDYLARPDAGF